MKVDRKKVEAEWSKTCCSLTWDQLSYGVRCGILQVIEACHEPVELTEEDVGRCWDDNAATDEDWCSWSGLSDNERRVQTQYANTLRRYTPPSLPTKLARAIEALGDEHPEAVRILKEAADGLETT